MFLSFLNLFRRPRCSTCGQKICRGSIKFLHWRHGALHRLCYDCWLETTKGYTD